MWPDLGTGWGATGRYGLGVGWLALGRGWKVLVLVRGCAGTEVKRGRVTLASIGTMGGIKLALSWRCGITLARCL